MRRKYSRMWSMLLSASLLMGTVSPAALAQEAPAVLLQEEASFEEEQLSAVDLFEEDTDAVMMEAVNVSDDGQDMVWSEETAAADEEELIIDEMPEALGTDADSAVADGFEEASPENLQEDPDFSEEELLNSETDAPDLSLPEEEIDLVEETEAMDESLQELAAERKEVSGTVLASAVPDGVDLRITGNTTLRMDKDLTLRTITGKDEYDIVVEGDHKLFVHNTSGRAIDVGDFRCSTEAEITSSSDYAVRTLRWFNVQEGGKVTIHGDYKKDAVHTDGNYGYIIVDEGGELTTTGRIITLKSDIYLDGKTNIRSQGENRTICADNGNIFISGDVTANSEYKAIWANKNVKITGGTLDIVAPWQGIYAKNDMTIDGAELIKIHAGGNLLTAGEGKLTIANTTIQNTKMSEFFHHPEMEDGISANNTIDIKNSKLTIHALNTDGIFSRYGWIKIDERSEVNVSGPDSAIQAKYGGAITIKGKVKASSTNDAAIWANNNTVEVADTAKVEASSANAEGIYTSQKMVINGAVKASGKTYSLRAGNGLTISPEITFVNPTNAVAGAQTIVYPTGDRVRSVEMDYQRFTITFEKNGGTGSMAAMTGLIKGKTYKLPDYCGFTPPKNKKFSGFWHVKELNGEYDSFDTITMDRNLTAWPVWEDVRKTINEVSVNGFVEPKPGAKILESGKVYLPQDAPYTASVSWYDDENRLMNASTYIFYKRTEDRIYRYFAKVTLRAKDGYKFSTDFAMGSASPDLKLNGKQTLLDLSKCGITDTAEETCVLVTNLMEPTEVITNVEVGGFVRPMAGEDAITKDQLRIPEDAPYEIEDMVWRGEYMIDGKTFCEGRKYYLRITLKAKSGFKFHPTKGGEGYDTFTLNYEDGSPAELEELTSGSTEDTSGTTDGSRLILETKIIYTYPLPKVDEVELTGFEVPLPGKQAITKEKLEVPAGVNYRVTALTWYEKGKTEALAAGVTFVRGKEYYAKIELETIGHNLFTYPEMFPLYTFHEFNLNGNRALISTNESGSTGQKTCVMTTVPMKACTIIKNAQVKGLVRPKPGDIPTGKETLMVMQTGAIAADLKWYEKGISVPVGEYLGFLQDKEYVAKIKLETKGDYVFSTDLSEYGRLSIEGNEVFEIDETESYVLSPTEILLVTKPIKATNMISSLEVSGFVAPKEGDHPVTGLTVPAGADYTIDRVTWYEAGAGSAVVDPSDTFKAGKLYCAEIELSPKSGGAFPGNAEAFDTLAVKSGEETVGLIDRQSTNDQVILRTVAFEVEHLVRPEDGWKIDSTSHWKLCSKCGEQLNKGVHTPGAWIVDKAATVNAAGLRHKECSVCRYRTQEEVIPKLSDPNGKPISSAVSGATQTQVDKFVTALPNDNDPTGSTFGFLFAKQKKTTKSSITISWKKTSKASCYVIYGARCGRGQKYLKLAKVTGSSYTQKNLKKGTYYKYLVSAFDRQGKLIGMSNTLHISTKGGSTGNLKKVTTAAKKNRVTLARKGKTFKLKGKAVKESSKLKVKTHRGVRYESSNRSVATVDSKGKITARGKGTCYITVYAQNGAYVRVKVTVKK